MKKRFMDAQIVGSLREADAELPVRDLCRRHGFSEASYLHHYSVWTSPAANYRGRLGDTQPGGSRRARTAVRRTTRSGCIPSWPTNGCTYDITTRCSAST